LALGFDRRGWHDRRLGLDRPFALATRERGISECKLPGDVGILAFVPTEGGRPSFGCALTEILAIMSHGRLLSSVINPAKTKLAGTGR
jgi:hypothetical protein